MNWIIEKKNKKKKLTQASQGEDQDEAIKKDPI